jgi:hypothetical protein
MGASVRCQRCRNYFTAVPAHDALAITAAGGPGPPLAALPVAALPCAASPLAVATSIQQRPRRRIDVASFGAIVLSIAALACVWFYPLCFLVMPLALLGSFLGLVALAVGLLAPRRRYSLAAVACIANALVVYGGAFNPWLLGPTYALWRPRLPVEDGTPHVVPLPGHKATADELQTEWPDASRYAVQIKTLRIQVVGATVRPLEIAQTPRRRYTKERYLVLRLRVQQPAGTAEFVSDRWEDAGKTKDRRRPVLTDDRGNVYQEAPSGEAGQLRKPSPHFPVGITDEVFVFDAPAAQAQVFWLELPATAWGGIGSVRFTIPQALLQYESTTTGKEYP